MTRDTGREQVYEGERQVRRMLDRSLDFPTVAVAGSTIALPQERHFGDLASIQRYIDAVLTHPAVRSRWPEAARTPVTVRSRKGNGRAHYQRMDRVIAIPDGPDGRWAMREMLVVHELSHHLAAAGGHGQEFRAVLAELAGIAIGPEMPLLLRVAWADVGLS